MSQNDDHHDYHDHQEDDDENVMPMDDSETGAEEPLTENERILMMAGARREHDQEQEEQNRARQATALIQTRSSTAAGQTIVGSIADPETQDRLIKLKEKADAAKQKELDHQKALLASTLVAGDPCVNILRGGKQCIRPADPDPAYGHMCRTCHYSRNTRELQKLSNLGERYEAKKRHKELKRQRDDAKAQEKERLIAIAQKKRESMLQKKRLKTLLFAPVAPKVYARPAAPGDAPSAVNADEEANNNNNNNNTVPVTALVACAECNGVLLVEKVMANQCDMCGVYAHQECRGAHLSRVHAPSAPVLSSAVVALPSRPRAQSSVSDDDGDDDGDLGIDLYKLNMADHLEEELAARSEELDPDYQEDDDEDEEDEDQMSVSDDDGDGDACVACLEAADPSNSAKCSSCGETLHHWAECIRDHSCSGTDTINIEK